MLVGLPWAATISDPISLDVERSILKLSKVGLVLSWCWGQGYAANALWRRPWLPCHTRHLTAGMVDVWVWRPCSEMDDISLTMSTWSTWWLWKRVSSEQNVAADSGNRIDHCCSCSLSFIPISVVDIAGVLLTETQITYVLIGRVTYGLV